MFDRQITQFTRLFLGTSLAGLPIALPQGLLKGIDYGHRNSSACMGSPARGIPSSSISLPRAQFSFGADFFSCGAVVSSRWGGLRRNTDSQVQFGQ